MRIHAILFIAALTLAIPIRAEEADSEAAAIAKIRLLGGWVHCHKKHGTRCVSISFQGGQRMTERFLHLLNQVQDLRVLQLVDLPISDAGAQTIGELTHLEQLNIADGSQLSNAGLKEIARLKNLDVLLIGNCTRITDEGIKEIGELENLSHLFLIGSQITDDGLQELARLKKLILINLHSTVLKFRSGVAGESLQKRKIDLKGVPMNFSEEGIAQLQASIPGVQIKH